MGVQLRTRGFTLIELLVTTSILVVITSVVLVNNARFGGAILLQSLAYDVALSVRQAQVYGISVARFGANTFSAGYGMHFDTTSPTTYLFFADAVSANGIYDMGELVPNGATTIGHNYIIAALCAPAGADATSCTRVSKLDILFKRPDPDASIRADSGATLYDSGRVILQSPRGDLMSVVVQANGQISVQK